LQSNLSMLSKASKPSAKAAAAAAPVHPGPSEKAKYSFPTVKTQFFVTSSGGSPINRKPNEEIITLHHMVTDHAIVTMLNKFGDSGFVNNIKVISMNNSKIKDVLNLIRWKCHHTQEDCTEHKRDRKGFFWFVAVVRIKEGQNTPEGGKKILEEWVKLGNSKLVNKLNGHIPNVFIMGSDLTPKEDDFLGNHLTEKDTLDVIRDVYVGYPDLKIESEPETMTAYFGPPHGIDKEGSKGSSTGSNGLVTEEDVTAFLSSLNNEEH